MFSKRWKFFLWNTYSYCTAYMYPTYDTVENYFIVIYMDLNLTGHSVLFFSKSVHPVLPSSPSSPLLPLEEPYLNKSILLATK